MKPSQMKWVAVAVFAAIMTVAEALALHAAARDAKRWVSYASASAREVREAGSAVVAAVTGASTRECSKGECVVIRLKGVSKDAARLAVRDARLRTRELRGVRWSLLKDQL
jgi:hypothetical protein